MRPLWPIEREVLEITAAEYSGSAEAIRRQIDTAQVTSFENSGAGFFSDLAVADDAPVLSENSPLSGAYGSVLGIGSCPTAWCSFSGVAALISGQGRVDHAAMDDNVTAGSSLNCVTLSSVM
jgi:hypothetical protein